MEVQKEITIANENRFAVLGEDVSPVVVKVGTDTCDRWIDPIKEKLRTFARFYDEDDSWRTTDQQKILEESKRDNTLSSLVLTTTKSIDKFLYIQHRPLYVALRNDTIVNWIVCQQVNGVNGKESEDAYHMDLLNEIQPMLAHFSEIKRVHNYRQRKKMFYEHANYMYEELKKCKNIQLWSKPIVCWKAKMEVLVEALESVPTPDSALTRILLRTRHGIAALNHVVLSLVEELANVAWTPKNRRTRYFRDGKEVKRKAHVIQAEAGITQEDTLTQQQNTIFTDQRETISDDGYITQQTRPDMQKISMPEEEWHVRNIMAKPIPFYSGEWNTSQTLGTIIKQWIVPGDTLFGPHYNQVSTFTFFRGHPTIRFQINGTKFHSGRLIAAFIPAFQFSAYDDVLYPVSALTSTPHVILDASIANSGVIDLPFVHMNTYFNTVSNRPHQSLGQLILAVFNKLRATDQASQSIGVTAWVHFEECELHQPCHAHTVALPKSKATQAPPIFAESGIEGIVKSAIPMVKDLIAPEISMGTSLLGNVMGGASNQDKPTDPLEIQRWVPNAVTGLSHGEGIDRSTRLCLYPGTYTIPDADMISTTKDDMNLLEIMKIPTRLYLFDWKSTLGAGSCLMHMPVCPNLFTGYTTDDSVTPAVEVISAPLLAYCVRNFKFWRGSLRYRVQVVSSQMHTGRLMVAYSAGINLSDYSFSKASYLNTYIIDLEEKHEVEFVVPFESERPWLRCDRFRKFDETGATEKSTDNYENVGFLDIYVLNRLSRPDSVAADVAVNIFISAGDDFEVSVQADLTAFQGIGNVIKKKSAPIQAEALVTEETVSTRTDAGNITLTKGKGYVKSAGATTMGENAMNLKTLLRRYNKCFSHYGSQVAAGSNWIRFSNTPVLSSVNKCYQNEGVQTRTPLAHFSELFTFWRGSLRYKFVYQLSTHQDGDTPIDNNLILRVFHIPGTYQPTNFKPIEITISKRAALAAMESYGVAVGTSKQQGSIEFEIPFYTPYTQLRTILNGLPGSLTSTGTVIITMDSPKKIEGTFMALDLYQAAGDDFTLNYLRAAPRVQFIKAYETTRDLKDNSTWLFDADPAICTEEKKTNGGTINSEPKIQAEAWQDHIPLLGPVNRASQRLVTTSIKVDSICDTAGHILQQASKKLGLTSSDEDEEETTTLVEDASSLCAPMVPVLEAALEYIKLLPNSLAQHFRPNLSIQDVLVEVSNLVSGFTAYINASNVLVKICAIVTIVSTLIKEITTSLKNSLYHLASQVFEVMNGSKQGNQLPQAETNPFDLVAPMTATLAVAVGAIGFKKIPTDKETIDMCRGISEKLKLFNFSSTAMTNVKKLWEEIKELMQWCIDYIMKLVAPELLAQLKLHQNFERIEEWTQFIDSLDNIAYADKIHYDGEFKNKIYRAIDDGKMYNTLLLEGKCGRAANVIREYVRKITEIGLHCERSKNELPFRKDPYCVFMFGGTNIGKSGCITTVGFDLMDRLHYPRHNRWCAINCTEKFFSENYRQQSAVYFDDFSTFTTEEQYQKFFNLKANTAYPLDMAFRKGEYFNSDFIFGTTNTPYPQPNFVTNHDALLRRRDKLIEADWADTPAIQEALAARENMRRHRQLDNSHLRFRFRNPENEQDPPGAWMTYAELIDEIYFDANEHLQIQQRKLTNDLTRAGYIVPAAEAGEVRRICVEAARNSPSLMLFDPELWPHLTWNIEKQEFEPESAEWEYAWEDMKGYFERALMVDLQKILRDNSYIVRPKTTLMTKVKLHLSEFKDFITNCYKGITETHPWIGTIGKWTIYLAAAISTLGALYFGIKKVAHVCMCKALTHYGYRCGLCGKWPQLDHVKESMKPFILEQWAKIYGSLPFKDNHVTSLQEEAALLSVQQQIEVRLEKAQLGTVMNAEGIYSDITKGGAPLRVMAQNGPYNQNVKGMAPVRVTANSSPYLTEVTGQAPLKITAQSQNTETIINARIFPYLYRMRTLGKVGLPSMSMSGYAIGDRWLMTCNHFFYGLENGDYFEVFHNGAWMVVEFQKERQVVVEKKDLCIYDMPITFHAHKSNIHHFVTEADIMKFQNGLGTLCKLNSQMRAIQVDNLNVSAMKEVKYEMTAAGVVVPLYVQKAWRYQKCSSFGDCGAPLVAYSDRLQGRILGIHIGSDINQSYAQLITREMLAPLVRRVEGTPIPEAEARLGNLIPPGHLGRIGKAPKGKGFFQSDKTEIIPTIIAGKITHPVTQPSVLSPNDVRLDKRVNPLRKGIEKYSHTSIPFPQEHRKIVNEMMKDETRQLIRSREPKKLTIEEACKGIPELEGYERLPLNTSPGYPWITTRPKGSIGKAYLFDEDGLPLFELQKSLEYRHEKAKQCERVESVWVDCLKDERRPIEKIKSGSTRVFTIPPVEYSLLMRMYTLDFSAAVKNSRAFMDCKVGIDPQSLEWTTLYYWLAEFSQYAVAGDFSRFDGSMPADIIMDVKEDIDYFYEQFGECTQEDKNVRQILFDELIHTVHLARDEFYMTHIGNKSGNPITVILNSRVNRRYMALAWLGLTVYNNRPEMFSMAKFKEYVRMADYGDDNIVMIKEEVIEWFNQETIAKYLAEYGIIYTNEEKTGITKFKTLNETTFLKQAFKDHETLPFIKVPHMKIQTITELLNWTRVAPDQDQLLFDNCNDALRFSYFYGEKFFNQLRDKIINALNEVQKNWLPKTYMDYHLWFLHTIGALIFNKSAEGEIMDIAHTDTTKFKRFLQALTVGPLMKMLVHPVKDDGRLRTERLAIVIPSGEGKTWLAETFPNYFVDHDDITLPNLERHVSHLKTLEKLAVVGNTLLNAQQYDTPEEDKRILLTHHPNATNRTIWRQYKLQYPNFNRNNYFNRLILDHPIRISREQRNSEILAFAEEYFGDKFYDCN